MKKVFILAFAAAAISFASCDNKPTNTKADAADSIIADLPDTLVTTPDGAAAAALSTIEELTAKIEAKDASAIQAALQKAQTNAAEFLKNDPDLAKQYLTKVQEFVKTNADKIKAAVGDNAIVNGLMTTLTTANADEVVTKFTEGISALGADADAAAADAAAKAEALKESVEKAPDAVKEAAKQQVETVKEDVKAKADAKVEEGKQKAGAAIDKAASDVKGKLGL